MSTPTIAIGSGSGGVGTANLSCFLNFVGTLTGSTQPMTLPVLSNANSPWTMNYVNLALGDNTINVNTITGAIIVILPTANTHPITLKGISGDTGIALAPGAWFLLTFAATPPTTFVINAMGAVTGAYVIQF